MCLAACMQASLRRWAPDWQQVYGREPGRFVASAEFRFRHKPKPGCLHAGIPAPPGAPDWQRVYGREPVNFVAGAESGSIQTTPTPCQVSFARWCLGVHRPGALAHM